MPRIFWIWMASATSCNFWKASARMGAGRDLFLTPPFPKRLVAHIIQRTVRRDGCFRGGDSMAPESDAVPSGVSPRQVWAFIPLESQQQIVQLLAHLAVHLIATQSLCQRVDVSVKERGDVHSSSTNEDPA